MSTGGMKHLLDIETNQGFKLLAVFDGSISPVGPRRTCNKVGVPAGSELFPRCR